MRTEAIRPGKVVELKKPHPCGGRHWEILRAGMDVKIRCTTCDRIVTLPRRKFVRRIKTIIEDEDTPD
jgi:hypothetical protein